MCSVRSLIVSASSLSLTVPICRLVPSLVALVSVLSRSPLIAILLLWLIVAAVIVLPSSLLLVTLGRVSVVSEVKVYCRLVPPAYPPLCIFVQHAVIFFVRHSLVFIVVYETVVVLVLNIVLSILFFVLINLLFEQSRKLRASSAVVTVPFND